MQYCVLYRQRGDIKIFDFGMARDLVPLQADQDGLYHLTKMTGSLRYMAPEVGLGKPYNEKCDVYSYSIVLWEMLNLSGKAYCHIPDEASFCEKVFVENVRPPLKRKWSVRLQKLLQEGWDKDPAGRPTMVHIRKSLLAEIQSCFLFEHDLTQRRRSTFLYQGKPSVNSEDNETRKAHAYSYSYDTTRSSILSYSNRSAP
jgi:serine/threonine protein kinase